jgi:hypothetical protein
VQKKVIDNYDFNSLSKLNQILFIFPISNFVFSLGLQALARYYSVHLLGVKVVVHEELFGELAQLLVLGGQQLGDTFEALVQDYLDLAINVSVVIV